MTDAVIEAVCTDIRSRAAVGQAKYGTTLERKDLTLRDWLQHAYEESLDHANYLKRALMEKLTVRCERRTAGPAKIGGW